MVFDDIRIALLEQNRQAPGQPELVERYKSLLKRELADRLPEGVQPDTVVISLPPSEVEALAAEEAHEEVNPFEDAPSDPEPEIETAPELEPEVAEKAEPEADLEEAFEASSDTDEGSDLIDIELPDSVSDPISEGVEEAMSMESEKEEEPPKEELTPKKSDPPPGTTPRGGGGGQKRGGRLRRWRRGR